MTKIRPEKTEQSLEVNVNANPNGFWSRARRNSKFWPTVATLAFLTITGTYGGQDGGVVPLYVKKTGTSYGICVAPVINLRELCKIQ